MAWTLEYDLEQVLPFMQRQGSPLVRCDGMRAIGLRRADGDLVAGVIYEGINRHNCWMHVAAVPGARWLTRTYLRACFAYPFLVCGVDRVRGYVEASNTAALRFDLHLGFMPEARLVGAADDGGDVVLLVMQRRDCRYV